MVHGKTKTFDFNCNKIKKKTKIPFLYANRSVSVMSSESNIEPVVLSV